MTGFLDIDGTRLEYRWAGEHQTGGTAIVLLHEGLGCVALWRGFPDALAAATGLPVLVYSRAGYGRSDPAALPRPVSFMHDEARTVLPRVLDAAGIGRAVLVGHSDGGSIALIAAATEGVKDRIAALVILAAHVFVEEVTLSSIREAEKAYVTTDLRARLARYHGDNVDCAFRGWHDIWLSPAFRDWTIEDLLPRITAPVLAIQGTEDEYGTSAHVGAIAADVSGPAESWMVPGSGHAPHVDATEEVLDRIAGFIGRYGGTAGAEES